MQTTATRAMATLPTPRFFDYETVRKNLNVEQALPVVEDAFGKLSEGKVREKWGRE